MRLIILVGVSINSYLKNSTPALSEYVLKTLERLDARENMKSSEIYKPKFPISMSNENSQQEDSRSRFQLVFHLLIQLCIKIKLG